MKKQPVTRELLPKVAAAMAKNTFFRGMENNTLGAIAELGELVHYSANETIGRQSSGARAFGVTLNGRVREFVRADGSDRPVEVRRAGGPGTYGLVEAVLGKPMRGTVMATEQVLALEFPTESLQASFARSSAFARQAMTALASRLDESEPTFPLTRYDAAKLGGPSSDVASALPESVVLRHRALPLKRQGKRLLVGFVGDLSAGSLQAVRAQSPSDDVQPVQLTGADFARLAQGAGISLDAPAAAAPMGAPAFELTSAAIAPAMPPAQTGPAASADSAPGGPVVRKYGPQREDNPKLDALLKRMVAEGASDLHLSALHKPRWRIDGEIREIAEARELGPETVMELFEPIMSDRQIAEFAGDGDGRDLDFAYALPGISRFRVNVFEDRLGIGAVLRTIPTKILTFEQLGLPKTIAKLCDHPKGMVLVTGPTGSGKSTTLAAMIDYINKGRRTHIITMEDPIEFVHKSRKALINQREMGVHSKGFKRALKAALRQDPDIVLVGELRDITTVSMAVETANTGHLVFGTLHTATAVSTVERIVDLFPPEQQGAVRAGVAEALKGVVAQTLLKKKGGGRIAALEIMVGSSAISNLIREGKMHQIPNIMLTAKKMGNQLLNEELEKLVKAGTVTYDEALAKSIDKPELAKRFGREYFEE